MSTSPHRVPSVSARIGARLIDYVLIGALSSGIGTFTGFGFGWLVGVAPLCLGYFVLSDALFGATLGKRVFGLRVLAPGGRPSLRAALAREWFVLLGAIPFVGPLLALVAWVTLYRTIRADVNGQGWHDRLAGGTAVVAADTASRV